MSLPDHIRVDIESEAMDVRHVGRILVTLCKAEALTEGGACPQFLNSIRYLGDQLDGHAEALLGIGRGAT
jgi:hypothetical protein